MVGAVSVGCMQSWVEFSTSDDTWEGWDYNLGKGLYAEKTELTWIQIHEGHHTRLECLPFTDVLRVIPDRCVCLRVRQCLALYELAEVSEIMYQGKKCWRLQLTEKCEIWNLSVIVNNRRSIISNVADESRTVSSKIFPYFLKVDGQWKLVKWEW